MADSPTRIQVSVPSQVKYLQAVRALIQESLDVAGFSEEQAADVVLAVQEACANVIRHCYQDCDEKQVDVTLSIGADEIEIRIDDYGEFVDPEKIKGRDLDDVRPGGLGVHLIRKAMDSVEYTKNEWGGTTLTLRKRRPEPEPEEGGNFL